MIAKQTVVGLVRIVHGCALTCGAFLAGGFLISVAEASGRRSAAKTMEYVALYAGSLFTHLLIAWFAWKRFQQCSFRASAASYCLWLVFFVWHGWFTEWAPYRLHEIPSPDVGFEVFTRIVAAVAVNLISYSLFPLLRFLAGGRAERRERRSTIRL
jgi:dipeptide/tripeptide permease